MTPGRKNWRKNSVILVETADSDVPWTEPRDFLVDTAEPPDRKSVELVAPHMRDNGYFYHETPYGTNVALGDGRILFVIAGSLRNADWKSLLAVNRFEEAFRQSSDDEDLRLNWAHSLGLPIWIVSVGLLLYVAVRSGRCRRGAGMNHQSADNRETVE